MTNQPIPPFVPPTGDDDDRVIATDRLLLRDGARGLGCTIITAGEEQHVPEPSGYAALWSGVIADCLDRVRRGEPAPTTPRDTARAVSLVFEAYEKAATLA